jgi:hypothetical protein
MASRAAGGCVLVALSGVALAVMFAASVAVGVLAVWVVGTVSLWRAARRRVSDSSATPPPLPESLSGDVYADGDERLSHVEWSPEGVRCTLHVTRGEVNDK